MTTQALTLREQGGSVLTKEGLAESAEQLKLLEDYVANVLHKDEDYGVIPGTNGKPTLLKPGAANIIAAFHAHIDGDDKCALEIMDPDKGKHGFVAYRIVVRIVSNASGQVLAMGQGSCNSYEAKYRYRNASPLCPACGKENIRKSKGGGFYCWAKTGGCGATFNDGDPAITSQPIGKVENENPFEQANTILKMAIKRATTDAALQIPGVARFFTQDLDDIAAPADATQDAPQGQQGPKPTTTTAKPAAAPPAKPQATQPASASGPQTIEELHAAIAEDFDGTTASTFNLTINRLTEGKVKTINDMKRYGLLAAYKLFADEWAKTKKPVVDSTATAVDEGSFAGIEGNGN